MRPMQRLVSAVVLIALSAVLTGCGSMTSWDPTDMLDFLDTKKKLPGDRKPVFPDGVPGLEQGVPKELYKDNVEREQKQEAADAAAAANPPPPPAPEPKTRKPKGRVSVGTVKQGAAPAAEPDAAASEEGAPASVPAAPKGKKAAHRRSTTVPPADQPAAAAPAAPAEQAPAASQSAFPAPLPSGSFSR